MQKSIWFFLCVVSSLLFFAPTVHAMQISPLRETRVVAPGSVERFEILVTNDSDHTAVYTGSVDAFRIDPVRGTPIFGQYVRALDWFTPGPEQVIAPGETKPLWFSLRVADSALPESFYLGLFAVEQQNGAQSRLGTLLFLHIEGETRESLSLQSLSANVSPEFLVTANILNTGDIHVVPQGELTVVYPITGRKYVTQINPDKHMILPGESAELSSLLPPLPWYSIGTVHVRADIVYGLSAQTIVHTMNVWRWPPLWFDLAAPTSILVVAVLIVYRKKQRHEV